MKQREHMNEQTKPSTDDSSPDEHLTAIRAEANDLLAAADRAFHRVRSEDSEAFLSQIRQDGGQ